MRTMKKPASRWVIVKNLNANGIVVGCSLSQQLLDAVQLFVEILLQHFHLGTDDGVE